MNIFNKVALQGLLKNRTRTFVTIIGVILSAAMMTGVATFATSLQNYMIQGSIMKYGDWHVGFSNVDEKFIKEQQADERVSNTIIFENIGYAQLENSKNENKPYLFIAGFNQQTFKDLPIKLAAGHYPKNDSEIIVPSHLKENGEVSIAIGEKLTLRVGQRMQYGNALSQYNSYQHKNETFIEQEEKTYTVVGTFQRPAFEEIEAPGYTGITKVDNFSIANSFSAFIKLENPRKIQEYVNEMPGQPLAYNDNVLRFMGLSKDKTFNTLLYSVVGILVALIMLGSVFLIYNAFMISLNERMRQFGILLSVGATAKRLRNSILFEGFCIGVVGIPLGLLVGIPTVSGVLTLVSRNFSNVAYSGVPLTLHVSLPIMLIAIAISFATILLSAYIPARKAVNTPILTCIRQTNEIKVQVKEVQTPKWLNRLLGLERSLALKNFRRNKRRYRTIVMSLILSVVLFVSASTFKITLQQAAESSDISTDYDILFFSENMTETEAIPLFNLLEKFKNVEGVYDHSYQAMMDCLTQVRVDDLTSRFRQILDADTSKEMLDLPLDVQFIEDKLYYQFIDQLGFDPKQYTGKNAKAIAVAKVLNEGENTNYIDIFTKQSKEFLLTTTNEEAQKLPIDITFVETYPFDPLPAKPSEVKPYTFMLIVPYQQIEEWGLTNVPMDRGLTFQSKNATSSIAQMEEIIQKQDFAGEYTIYNMKEIFEQNRNIIFIVNLFTIVFIVMMTLIAIANVFNTISTNIHLRRRELAMLRSIGMSNRDFNKMMRFECILYGFQTLLFGIPISGLLSWLIYKGMFVGGADVNFTFPWISMMMSIAGVFIIILITAMYAINKIKKENIIDALRDEL